MSYQNIAEDLRGIKGRIQSAQQVAGMRSAFNALALIKKRVISDGKDSRGSSFDPYSDNPLPTFFFTKGANKGALKKIAGNDGGVSYKEWRQANNLQVKHRDFRFTGRMWANIKPIIQGEGKDGSLRIVIDADNAKEGQKVQWNIDRDGNFLAPSSKELEFTAQTYNKEFAKLLFEG